jgi:hypothetical protein
MRELQGTGQGDAVTNERRGPIFESVDDLLDWSERNGNPRPVVEQTEDRFFREADDWSDYGGEER